MRPGESLQDWPAVDRLSITRAASKPAPIEGSYSTALSSGYALTLTVDSRGEVFGSDTNGCQLNGRAFRVRPTDRVHAVQLGVSGCGELDGSYRGYAASFAGENGSRPELFLSASKDDAAIGWRLTR